MEAGNILKKLADHCLEDVHVARIGAVFAAVRALIRGGDIAVSRLGRAIATRTSVKHGIKRIDRLYSNKKLGTECKQFYRGLARIVLGRRRSGRPVVLIDWTEAGPSTCVLAAAVPGSGRALIIYAEAHSLRGYMNPQVEARFLRNLRDVLPSGTRPVVVTDAGFRAPWLRAVEALGWDYVGRIRGRTRIRPIGDRIWVSYTTLYKRAFVQRAFDAGIYYVTRYKPYETRLVVFRGRRRWRPLPKALAMRATTRAVECAKEPWLLATSLRLASAKNVVRFYTLRMQIEQTFRDTKSDRFGWAMGRSRTRRSDRIKIMVLLAAICSAIVFATGKAAELAGLHRAFQANTIRSRRVLALTTLGRLILLHPMMQGPPSRFLDLQFECCEMNDLPRI